MSFMQPVADHDTFLISPGPYWSFTPYEAMMLLPEGPKFLPMILTSSFPVVRASEEPSPENETTTGGAYERVEKNGVESCPPTVKTTFILIPTPGAEMHVIFVDESDMQPVAVQTEPDHSYVIEIAIVPGGPKLFPRIVISSPPRVLIGAFVDTLVMTGSLNDAFMLLMVT